MEGRGRIRLIRLVQIGRLRSTSAYPSSCAAPRPALSIAAVDDLSPLERFIAACARGSSGSRLDPGGAGDRLIAGAR